MIRWMILLSVLSSLSFSQNQLKVITYNIMGMKPGTQHEARLSQIIHNLKQLDPDIIGLQEINETLSGGGLDNQARIIADSLGGYFGIPYHVYYSQTHLSWNNQYRELVGIISKYPVEQQEYGQLATGAFPRRVVWNHVLTPLGRINFFNTHLDYQSTSVRNQQVQQILAYIEQKETACPGIATLLTGDFNDTPDSAPIMLLKSGALQDTWPLANPLSPGYTIPSNAPTSKIDFIFHKGKTLNTDSASIIMRQPYRGLFLSDHCGVMTIFSSRPAGVQAGKEGPNTVYLGQNYPNPFNARTVICYHLNIRERVKLQVYDLLGAEIATLVNEVQGPGAYTCFFDATKYVTGTYFYRIIKGSGFLTRKMLVIK